MTAVDYESGKPNEGRRGLSRASRVRIVILMVLVCYVAGHGWIRAGHHFLHDATYYTDTDGQKVRTDQVRLGEWRSGAWFEFASAAYWPMCTAEAWLWRMSE